MQARHAMTAAMGLALVCALGGCGPRESKTGVAARTVDSTNVVSGGLVSFEDCHGREGRENGATLSLQGKAAWSVGRAGCAIDLEGSSSFVDLGSAYLAPDNSFSMAAWISLGESTHASTLISQPGSRESAVALRYTGAGADGRPGRLALATLGEDETTAGANLITGNVSLLPGRWTHVAATFDAQAQMGRLYVDGVPVGSGRLSAGMAKQTATLIGAEWSQGSRQRFFDGRIDEVEFRPGVFTDEAISAKAATGPTSTPLRAPSTPLIVRDPYVSSWQPSDPSGRDWTRFWTGAVRALYVMVRVDRAAYQLVGSGDLSGCARATELHREITPTETRSSFVAGPVAVDLTFTADVDLNSTARLAAPLGSVVAHARSIDGRSHQVALYADVTGEWAHANTATSIDWSLAQNATGSVPYAAFHIVPVGATAVSELNDGQTWGDQWWAASGPNLTYQSGEAGAMRGQFVAGLPPANKQDGARPRAIRDNWPTFAFGVSLGQLDGALSAPMTMTLGQVRTPAVTYDGNGLMPWWTTRWTSAADMVADVHQQAASLQLRGRNQALDRQIWRDATRLGGHAYAALCALSFRQLFGSLQLVRYGDQLWTFLKEISSNGNMSTVDVIYPSMPLLLYLQPSLLQSMLLPLLSFSESSGWPQPFAPHDLGASFPNATLHKDGGGENMPVEESANMILMMAAYAQEQNDATSTAFVAAHYPILAKWADYLVSNTLDPNLQNQTDDFTGFIAHSSNLALKGILALGAMEKVAMLAKQPRDAGHYRAVADNYVAKWGQYSLSSDKGHLKLAYDEDGTWSQKYNLFLDKLLGLNLVPASTYDLEARYYKTKMSDFGLPLDNRHSYTKLDWSLWTAAATDDLELRRKLIDTAYRFANETPSRAPLSDWYETKTGVQVGFQARPVVGGIYALMARARAGN